MWHSISSIVEEDSGGRCQVLTPINAKFSWKWFEVVESQGGQQPQERPLWGNSLGCLLFGFLDGKNRPSSFFFLEKKLKLGHFVLQRPKEHVLVVWGIQPYRTGVKQNSKSFCQIFVISFPIIFPFGAYYGKQYWIFDHIEQTLCPICPLFAPIENFVMHDRTFSGKMRHNKQFL